MNEYGQGGSNNRDKSQSMVQVGSDTNWGQDMTKISTGGNAHSTGAIKQDGTLWTWGRNDQYGQLGQNNLTLYSSPVQIPGTNWSTIYCGHYYMRATKTDGTIWTWGQNNAGYKGRFGTNDTISRSSPVQIPGTDWSQKAQGNSGYGAASIALKQSD